LTIRLCGKKGGAVENMVYYKDSNPFMVHMLLLWFSGWYSFYRENMVYYKDSNPFMVHMLLLWFSGWYSFYRYFLPVLEHQ
jgi:hypothetical protein